MKKTIFLSAVLALAASANAQVVYSTDFETDQSANFTVQSSSADFVANFNYDYSTYAPTSPTDGPASIPAAPSGAGTKGLRLAANVDGTNGVEAVSAFINAAASTTHYILKWDAFQQYNGPGGDNPVGGTGTTTFMTAGDASSGTVASFANTAMNGFIWGIANEAGATSDLQYSEGNGTAVTALNASPNWLGSNATSSTAWETIFPNPAYVTKGAPGRAWTTWEMEVNGNAVTVFVTPSGGSRQQVGAWTVAATGSTSGSPFVGYADTFASSPVPAVDNFVIIDNLSVTIPEVPTAARAWELYN